MEAKLALLLAGMVAASLACLAKHGRFVEVGKRDIWSPQRVAQERPDLAYRLVAIDFWSPALVGAAMARLAGMLAKGAPSRVLFVSEKVC